MALATLYIWAALITAHLIFTDQSKIIVGRIRYPKNDPDLAYWRKVKFNVDSDKHTDTNNYSNTSPKQGGASVDINVTDICTPQQNKKKPSETSGFSVEKPEDKKPLQPVGQDETLIEINVIKNKRNQNEKKTTTRDQNEKKTKKNAYKIEEKNPPKSDCHDETSSASNGTPTTEGTVTDKSVQDEEELPEEYPDENEPETNTTNKESKNSPKPKDNSKESIMDDDTPPMVDYTPAKEATSKSRSFKEFEALAKLLAIIK